MIIFFRKLVHSSRKTKSLVPGFDAEDVFMHMMRHQNEHRIFDEKSEYVKYRRILVDWLADIQLKFHLQPHTTHVAVMYMDRIMQSCVVRPSLSLFLSLTH